PVQQGIVKTLLQLVEGWLLWIAGKLVRRGARLLGNPEQQMPANAAFVICYQVEIARRDPDGTGKSGLCLLQLHPVASDADTDWGAHDLSCQREVLSTIDNTNPIVIQALTRLFNVFKFLLLEFASCSYPFCRQ